MTVRIELTYEMAKALGTPSFDVEAATVADALDAARKRFAGTEGDFETLTARAAVAINGVLVRHRGRSEAGLNDGDTVAFVKAAAGG